MADITLLLLGAAFIMFFGFLAEFIFKRVGIPDILFLVILGLVIGPSVLGYFNPAQIAKFAPIFTTFALFFLVYNGAFNIDLEAFKKGLRESSIVMFYNFLLSVAIVTSVVFIFTNDILISLLSAFILSGISSAFTIPVVGKLKIKKETYSALVLESTFTDVFTIVFSLTILDLILIGIFDPTAIATNITSLFAVAGFFGLIGAVVWIILCVKVFELHRSYMLTIAYLIFLYVITELMGGNGVIAALFFGLVLRNSEQLVQMTVRFRLKVGLMLKRPPASGASRLSEYAINIISKRELDFYSEISFFLKTFFFVYVGLMLDLSNSDTLLIGFILSTGLMASRFSTRVIMGSIDRFDRGVFSSVFARGLAAAAIVQVVVSAGIPGADFIANVCYATILFTIVLSSVMIFVVRLSFSRGEKNELEEMSEEEPSGEEGKDEPANPAPEPMKGPQVGPQTGPTEN